MKTSLHDPRAIGAQIRMRVPQLTPLEARVVESITGRTDLVESRPLKTIAADVVIAQRNAEVAESNLARTMAAVAPRRKPR